MGRAGTGVEVSAYAYVDVRFELLKKRAQLADADHARGKVERLWLVCMQRETDVLAPIEVAAVVNVGALVEAELGELVPGGVRIRGVRSRLEAIAAAEAALERQREIGRQFGHLGAEHGKKGGRPRKKPPDQAGNPLQGSGGGKGGVRPLTADLVVDREKDRSPDGDRETVEGGVGGDPKTPAPVSVHHRFIAGFTGFFEQAYGAKPSWGGKGGEIVRKLLLEHGLDESLRRARIMLLETAADAFPAAPRDIATLYRFFDRFAQVPRVNGHANGRRDRAAEILAQARAAAEEGR